MADLTITAASVVPGTNAIIDRTANAGETITAGQPVYKDSTSKKWMKSDNNASGKKTAGGVALNGASLNQPLAVQTGGAITIGATVVAGTVYCLSETAGGICPQADVTTGDDVVQLGIAASTTVINLDIQVPGVTL